MSRLFWSAALRQPGMLQPWRHMVRWAEGGVPQHCKARHAASRELPSPPQRPTQPQAHANMLWHQAASQVTSGPSSALKPSACRSVGESCCRSCTLASSARDLALATMISDECMSHLHLQLHTCQRASSRARLAHVAIWHGSGRAPGVLGRGCHAAFTGVLLACTWVGMC